MNTIDRSVEELIKEIQELKQENSTLKALYEKDILERHRIEADLIQSEARFRYLFQDIENISVQGYGLDGTTQYWNSASEKLYGYSAREAIGQNLVDLIIPPEMKEVVKKSIQEMAASGQPIPAAELSLIRKNGSLVTVFSSHVIVNIPGQGPELFCIDVDLTKLKETEKELIQAEESDRLKSAFLANMSHEIRTPMNGILGFADLLKNQQLTGDQQQEYIRIIMQSGDRMLNILNDIIDISRIEAGHMKLDIAESNFNEQCEYIYTFFKTEVEAKGINFLLKPGLPNQETLISTDREKLYAILTNLVKNSIKYTPAGSIELGYSLTDSPTQLKELQFYVKDTGIGIPKDRFEAIFKRFIQSDIDNKMANQGAGLGLSITKAYVEMLGGKIWVESEEGIGSTFYFTLPYNTNQTNQTIQKELPPEINEDLLKKLKILIVEDDKISEKLIDITVNRIGREILKVGTGIEAIEACRNNPDIDLILMDIQMPEMNGYEATHQIRQFNNDVVIIAQTANGLNQDREKTIAAGCNDYITKPINKTELHFLIKKYFNN
jgi:PAS domain S-box-containing protein